VSCVAALSLALLIPLGSGAEPVVDAAGVPASSTWALPAAGAVGAIVGGVGGAGAALAVVLVAEAATGEEASPTSRGVNRLATFGSLVAPAVMSVGGAVVGAGWQAGLPGALTVGFGATMGAALGTGAALAVVPVGPAATELPGGEVGATAAIGGIVVGAAAVGAAVAGVVAVLTLDPVLLDGDDGGTLDADTGAEAAADTESNFTLDAPTDRR
jgi:hypothetical protein